MPRKADYTYELTFSSILKWLLIVDLNLGNVSVTNAIEQVVDEIAENEQINVDGFIILYCDSDGVWDGWDPRNQTFYHVGGESPADAMEKYMNQIVRK